MGLGQAEQLCMLSVDMYICLYTTVQIPGAWLPVLSRGFIDTFGKIWDRQIDTQIHIGVCRVASATKNKGTEEL